VGTAPPATLGTVVESDEAGELPVTEDRQNQEREDALHFEHRLLTLGKRGDRADDGTVPPHLLEPAGVSRLPEGNILQLRVVDLRGHAIGGPLEGLRGVFRLAMVNAKDVDPIHPGRPSGDRQHLGYRRSGVAALQEASAGVENIPGRYRGGTGLVHDKGECNRLSPPAQSMQKGISKTARLKEHRYSLQDDGNVRPRAPSSGLPRDDPRAHS